MFVELGSIFEVLLPAVLAPHSSTDTVQRLDVEEVRRLHFERSKTKLTRPHLQHQTNSCTEQYTRHKEGLISFAIENMSSAFQLYLLSTEEQVQTVINQREVREQMF